jgi:ATP phosphoribosyltransferase|tara:strand:- start:12448 stop:13299 length:852 start_codon:yes stop_codon:yes gene_type:complete
MIKIAIQKSGRLNEGSLNLLKNCGVNLNNGEDQLKTSSANFPLEVFFLRNSDIPNYLKDGIVDLAIIGENLLIEKDLKVPILEKLDFAKCRVSIAVPKEFEYRKIRDLNGIKIATSYPNTIKSFLVKNNIKASLHIINGSVEIAPNIGLSDAICDLVSSGSTLFKNNLKEIIKINTSEAVLVKSSILNKSKIDIIEKLRFRIRSVLKAKKSRYILLNAPNNRIKSISNILPVLKSPTVLPLEKDGWSSLHSVINEDKFWEVIDKLKEEGAEDILVCPIEKMVL